MKDEYKPIKIKESVKKKLVEIQEMLIRDLKRKVSLNETVEFLIGFYKS